MSEFVEECRREWRRLGVPDLVANEMAADLSADLAEAEAEGASPEDVLGNSAFDPRRFAASWAMARGVTNQPAVVRSSMWRPPVAIALAGCLAVLVAAGLLLLVGFRSRSFASAARPIRLFAPGPHRIAVPGPLGPFVGSQITGLVHPLALILLIVGVVGLLGLLAVLYWSPWSSFHRYQRHVEGRTRNWNS